MFILGTVHKHFRLSNLRGFLAARPRSTEIQGLKPYTPMCMKDKYRRYCSTANVQDLPKERPGFTRRSSDSWDPEELRTLPMHLRPVQGETLDLILRQKAYLLQSRRGYRANVDSHILAHFAFGEYRRVSTGKPPKPVRVLDLGAGNGLVSILFARAHQLTKVHMIELQPQLAERARRNIELNSIDGDVTQFDLKDGRLPDGLCGRFDVVLINPPFYPAGSRKPPKHREKHLAHQESSATCEHFLRAAHSACDRQNHEAFIAIIQDRNELPRVKKAILQNDLGISESREMIHVDGEEPSRILLKVKTRAKQSRSLQAGSNYGDRSCTDLLGFDAEFSPSLPPLVLFPSLRAQSIYTEEIEEFLDILPIPSLRIGRLRDT